MLCVFALLFIMCLHPKLDLYQQDESFKVADLETFDTCDYVYSVTDTTLDDLVVLQLYIRGLSSKQSMLLDLLNSCVTGRTPDIVLLSETWLTPTSPTVLIPGYDFVHCVRTHKCGGGVGILIAQNLRYKECDKIMSSIVENECVTIELELRSHDKCIIPSM